MAGDNDDDDATTHDTIRRVCFGLEMISSIFGLIGTIVVASLCAGNESAEENGSCKDSCTVSIIFCVILFVLNLASAVNMFRRIPSRIRKQGSQESVLSSPPPRMLGHRGFNIKGKRRKRNNNNHNSRENITQEGEHAIVVPQQQQQQEQQPRPQRYQQRYQNQQPEHVSQHSGWNQTRTPPSRWGATPVNYRGLSPDSEFEDRHAYDFGPSIIGGANYYRTKCIQRICFCVELLSSVQGFISIIVTASLCGGHMYMPDEGLRVGALVMNVFSCLCGSGLLVIRLRNKLLKSTEEVNRLR